MIVGPVEVIYNAMVVFGIVALIGYIFYRLTKKPKKKYMEKNRIYTCGEDLAAEDLNIPSATFYKYLINLFGIKKLMSWHSGNLNNYLLWIFGGMIIIIVILVVFL